jgi:NAD(P)-dependent dehydrogenase (short-subunit alcohol dehydrogenase family)
VRIDSRAGSAEFAIGGSVNVALLYFTKSMADIGTGQSVRVDAICPELVETDRFTRNVERVMRDRSRSRDEATTFLLASHVRQGRQAARDRHKGRLHAGLHHRY